MVKEIEQWHYKETRERLRLFNLERRRVTGRHDQSLQNFYSQNPAVLELGTTH